MTPNAKCRNCGLVFPFPLFAGVMGAAIGNSTNCPRCNGQADIENMIDGQVIGPRFLVEAARAFGSASVVDLAAFQRVAESAVAGEIGMADAQQRSSEIDGAFGRLFALAMQWGIPSLLIAAVALYLQLRESHAEAIDHAEMMRVLERQAVASEQIARELKTLRSADPSLQQPPVIAVPSHPTRQVRRQAERQERKNQPR